MNVNEISPKCNSQLNRIQKVCGIFRTFFFAVAILLVFGALAALLQIFFIKTPNFSAFQFITVVVVEIAGAIWAWLCYRLFDLCAHGDLFTSKVVSCIRRVGYAYFLMAIASCSNRVFSFYGTSNSPTTYHPDWPFWFFNLASALFPGFLIIFIAWVMDEGRKIQEEQELTV